MSQPWHKASWTPAQPGPSWAQPGPAEPGDDPAADWAGTPGRIAGPADDPPGRGAPPDRARDQATGQRHGPQLTGRGAIAGMLLVFFFGVLAASWLHWGLLAGGSFLAGSAAAAWYTKQRDLLTVAVSPPLLFFFVLIVVKALTASGSAALRAGGDRADPGQRGPLAVRRGRAVLDRRVVPRPAPLHGGPAPRAAARAGPPRPADAGDPGGTAAVGGYS